MENNSVSACETLLVASTLNNKNKGNLTMLLMRASEDGNKELVRQLLECGVDPNAKGTDLWTPLHFAARKGHSPTARLLLKHGADANARAKFKPNSGNILIVLII